MTTYLDEAIGSANFPRAALLIQNYLKRHLSRMIYLYPEPEHVRSGSKTIVGIRYFLNRIESFRLNWLTDGSIDTSKNLLSVDYWSGLGKSNRPTLRMTFDQSQSLVKSLPMIADFLRLQVEGDQLWVVEESALISGALANMSGDFAAINEAKASSGNAMGTIANVIHAFEQGLQQKDLWNNTFDRNSLGPSLGKVLDTVKKVYPEFFEKQGISVVFTSKANAKKMSAAKIAAAMGLGGAIAATVGSGVLETIIASKEIEAMEDNFPRLAYEEQLSDLRRAMVLVMNNATNSLYIAGRGGVGKTETVEQELEKHGLTDGSGYFKITGSASTAGIYALMYKHRNDILLFDDSDGALADMDSRNLFKAASDTKKIRRISWMKAGKNYVDPEDMDDDNEADDRLPRYFDFKGKIIFISNLKIDKLDPDGALRTRGYLVTIDPLDIEVYDFMIKIVDKIRMDVDYALSPAQKREVIEILRSRKLKEGSANLRQLVRGLNTMAGILKDGGTDYLSMILRYA